jgi:hypothetical protein
MMNTGLFGNKIEPEKSPNSAHQIDALVSPPFKVGEKVTTDFYKWDKKLIRTVTQVFKPRIHCESGWFVETKDEHNRYLTIDSNWYKRSG